MLVNVCGASVDLGVPFSYDNISNLADRVDYIISDFCDAVGRAWVRQVTRKMSKKRRARWAAGGWGRLMLAVNHYDDHYPCDCFFMSYHAMSRLGWGWSLTS